MVSAPCVGLHQGVQSTEAEAAALVCSSPRILKQNPKPLPALPLPMPQLCLEETEVMKKCVAELMQRFSARVSAHIRPLLHSSPALQ